MSTNTQHRFENESDYSESALNVDLYGKVQGVGLRPWLYRLAQSHDLHGQIFNHSAGTRAVLEGRASNLLGFRKDLSFALEIKSSDTGEGTRDKDSHLNTFAMRNFPAQVERVEFSDTESRKLDRLEILNAPPQNLPVGFIPLTLSAPPDLATCRECWFDFSNPDSRFFNYPFISCTSCGPRWTITRKLPFDRENTSYADFEMCSRCEAEYFDASSRRFFSQTMSCEKCGPKLQLQFDTNRNSQKNLYLGDVLKECSAALKAGKIGVIKGMGGFQLIGNALDESVIKRIRAIKQRPEQALAVMFRDFETLQLYGGNANDWKSLRSPEGAILAISKLEFPTRPLIATDLNGIGAMAPTTPFHYILQNEVPLLIFTSANSKDSPIPRSIEEVEFRIGKEVDFIVDHNREVTFPIDDSVVKNGRLLRAARGYLPRLHSTQCFQTRPENDVLALGADLKTASAITRKGVTTELPYAGTLSTLAGLKSLKSRLEKQLKLFEFVPSTVLCDFHPETLTSQLNPFPQLAPTRVPHHLAHAMASQTHSRLVLAFDGTGFNGDADVNGGEGYIRESVSPSETGPGRLARRLQFEPTTLVGGTSGAKDPWRFAVSSLVQAGLSEAEIQEIFPNLEPRIFQVVFQLSKSRTLIKTTSAGRWFDAASAIVCFGTRSQSYEAQAPIQLETLAAKSRSPAVPELFSASDFVTLCTSQPNTNRESGYVQIAGARLLAKLAEFKISNLYPDDTLAFWAHEMLAQVVAEAAKKTIQLYGAQSDDLQPPQISVTGGVFQNDVLLNCLEENLKMRGLILCRTFEHPVNDQSIAIGQTRWWLQCMN